MWAKSQKQKLSHSFQENIDYRIARSLKGERFYIWDMSIK